MELYISRFRCYDTASFRLSQSGITLIKGPSGIGKTTLLQCVSWCWHGSQRGVESLREGKGELSVLCRFTIPIRGICEIYRWKGKGKIRVTVQERSGPTTYEGPTAQSIIDNVFGDDNMWNIAVCINQREHNALLSRSGTERMDVIKKFAFGDDNQRYTSSASQPS